MKLTKPQIDELRRLAKEPQNTFGKYRARVQNNLRAKGLARLYDSSDPSRRATVIDILVNAGIAPLYDTCAITDAGRAELEKLK